MMYPTHTVHVWKPPWVSLNPMFNVCYNCGAYRADKIIDPSGPYAVCPECGHRHRFRQLPLFIVGGASGAGKSTVCQALTGVIEDAVLLDSDILWRPEFNKPDQNFREYFELWLRMAKNISQSGRPVVLFGAGIGVPENVEPCIERRYFARVHYLALVCDDDVLAQRLKARPVWRGSGDPAYIEEHVQFNRWFRQQRSGDVPITLLDTTRMPLETTLQQVQRWLQEFRSGSTNDPHRSFS